MPRVEQNGMPTSLHYALTDSQCSKCGKQLEWNAKELKHEPDKKQGLRKQVLLHFTILLQI